MLKATWQRDRSQPVCLGTGPGPGRWLVPAAASPWMTGQVYRSRFDGVSRDEFVAPDEAGAVRSVRAVERASELPGKDKEGESKSETQEGDDGRRDGGAPREDDAQELVLYGSVFPFELGDKDLGLQKKKNRSILIILWEMKERGARGVREWEGEEGVCVVRGLVPE